MGHLLYRSNNIAVAVKYYQKAIEIDPNDYEIKVGLANCYYMLAKYEDAIKYYKDIAKGVEDNSDDIYYNLGNFYMIFFFIFL